MDYDDLPHSVNNTSTMNESYTHEHEANSVSPYLQWLMMSHLQQVQKPQPPLPQIPRPFPSFPSSSTLSMDQSKSMSDHHKCNICHRFFNSGTSLLSHQQYNHMPMKKPIYCCDQPFTTRWELKLHKTEHKVDYKSNGKDKDWLEQSL